MPNDASTTDIHPTRSVGQVLGAFAIVGAALAAGIGISSLLERQSGQAFPGRLQAQTITLSADQSAILREVHVSTGQRVSTGEPLFVLECEAQQIEGQRRRDEAERRAMEEKRIQATAELELNWRRRELQAEMFQTRLKLASLREQKLHLEVEQVAWREQLSIPTAFSGDDQPSPLFRFLGDGAPDVAGDRLQAMLKEDAAASAAAAIAAQIDLCEQRLLELKGLDEKLERQIRLSHGVDDAEAQQQVATAAVPAEIDDPAATTVTSPSYGVLGVFHKQPGERLAAGETLVQILDDDRRTIEVEVPSWAAVGFTPGRTVRLEFPGGVERTGVIAQIPPQTSAQPADAQGDVPIELTISPSGKSWPQHPIGSRVLVYQP